ncbi:hypothetical protein [Brevibacillus sp. 179-C8.5 HS]
MKKSVIFTLSLSLILAVNIQLSNMSIGKNSQNDNGIKKYSYDPGH